MTETDQWLGPSTILDLYVRPVAHEDAAKWLYLAVITGRVRIRARTGPIFGPQTLKNLSRMKFDDTDPWALPPDLVLSVADAKIEWGID
jgi:hypothetical protein